MHEISVCLGQLPWTCARHECWYCSHFEYMHGSSAHLKLELKNAFPIAKNLNVRATFSKGDIGYWNCVFLFKIPGLTTSTRWERRWLPYAYNAYIMTGLWPPILLHISALDPLLGLLLSQPLPELLFWVPIVLLTKEAIKIHKAAILGLGLLLLMLS